MLEAGYGWVVACPHCGTIKQLSSQLLYDCWYEADDDARYYIFHETQEFLRDYWSSSSEGSHAK